MNMKKLKYISLVLIALFTMNLNAQNYHFGIRAGMNYAKFLGPSEANVVEDFNLNNGFHFGIVGLMELNDYFSVGAEILYNQLGSKYHYEGQSYYKFGEDFIWENLTYDLEVSSSYINIPIQIHFQPIKRFEIIAGGYFGFLVSPVAGGKFDFGEKFFQYPEHNYYSDDAGGVPYGASYDILNVIVPQDDGTEEIAQIHKTPGAYYHYTLDEFNSDTGKKYNWFDIGLTGGFTYFINSSLYTGVKVEYGLLDITNKNLDRSLNVLDEDENFILRDDYDTNLNFQVSLGFRF